MFVLDCCYTQYTASVAGPAAERFDKPIATRHLASRQPHYYVVTAVSQPLSHFVPLIQHPQPCCLRVSGFSFNKIYVNFSVFMLLLGSICSLPCRTPTSYCFRSVVCFFVTMFITTATLRGKLLQLLPGNFYNRRTTALSSNL